MEKLKFYEVSTLFNELESYNKKLQKTLLLRDFIEKWDERSWNVLDVIAGNFQRQINKKNLGISLKTCFEVLSFVTREKRTTLETEFNKIGDIGEVAKKYFKEESQKTLSSEDLYFEDITDSLKNISEKSGKESNRVKKEILSKLFMSAHSPLEYKFLARLLIDDLRIGVMEGIIREASVNAVFPKIINIHLLCDNCGYWNFNFSKCFNCSETLDEKQQQEIINSSEYELIKFDSWEKILVLPKQNVISADNPREIYNYFLNLFEKKYNVVNSFYKILKELKNNRENIFEPSLYPGIPIKSMLGERSENITEAFNMTGKPSLLDFKYDGLRVQIHNNKGDVWLFTRKLEDITSQFPEIVEYIKENFSNTSFIIDTECVGYDFEKKIFLPFQTLSRRILTKEYGEVSHIKVVVKTFDILYLEGESLIDLPYKDRRDKMTKFLVGKPMRQRQNFDLEELKKLANQQ